MTVQFKKDFSNYVDESEESLQEELEKVTLLVEQAETKKEKIEATIELRKCKARLQAVA